MNARSISLPLNSFCECLVLKIGVHLGSYLWQCILRLWATILFNVCLFQSISFEFCPFLCLAEDTLYSFVYAVTILDKGDFGTPIRLFVLDMNAPVRQASIIMPLCASDRLDIMTLCSEQKFQIQLSHINTTNSVNI